MWIWFSKFGDINHINMISNIFTAIGTVGAVIVALWLANKDNKSKLRVDATLGVITPDMTEHLWLSCVNVSKIPIICTGFAFNPNKFKKKGFLMPPTNIEIQELSTHLPRQLQYSDKADKYFNERFFDNGNIKRFLPKYKWLAKIKLKCLWRIVATTNIKQFEGKLSNELIEKFLSLYSPRKEKP